MYLYSIVASIHGCFFWRGIRAPSITKSLLHRSTGLDQQTLLLVNLILGRCHGCVPPSPEFGVVWFFCDGMVVVFATGLGWRLGQVDFGGEAEREREGNQGGRVWK